MGEQGNPAFNQALLKRFVNLMGLFPVGNLVRLNTDELAVVTAEHPTDPFRPQVKIIIDRDGRDARGAAARQHVGARRARRASARGGRSGRSGVDRHRSAEVSLMAELTDAPAPLDADRDGAADRVRARLQGRRARGRCSTRPAIPAIAATLGRIAQHHARRRAAGAAEDHGAARRPAARRAAAGARRRRAHRAGGAAAQPSDRRADDPPRRRRRGVAQLPAAARPLAGIGAHRRRHRARLDDDGRPPRRAARDRLRRGAARALRRRSRRSGTQVIANCLQGSAFDLDDAGIRELLEHRRRQRAARRADGDAREQRATAAAASAPRPPRSCACCAASSTRCRRASPSSSSRCCSNMAAAVGQLLAGDAARAAWASSGDDDEGPQLMQAVVSRMTDAHDRALRRRGT